ncbi:hypothetical protein CLERM_056 [Coxiella-like endosymbiont]|nr:hypothetical protein CLERM_056 [Coxiella-like endosymbiont]
MIIYYNRSVVVQAGGNTIKIKRFYGDTQIDILKLHSPPKKRG